MKAFFSNYYLFKRASFIALNYSFQEISYTQSYLRIIMNKPIIEISKFKKYLDVIKQFKLGLFYNIINSFKVYSNISCFNNKAKKLDFFNIKLVFTKFII